MVNEARLINLFMLIVYCFFYTWFNYLGFWWLIPCEVILLILIAVHSLSTVDIMIHNNAVNQIAENLKGIDLDKLQGDIETIKKKK